MLFQSGSFFAWLFDYQFNTQTNTYFKSLPLELIQWGVVKFKRFAFYFINSRSRGLKLAYVRIVNSGHSICENNAYSPLQRKVLFVFVRASVKMSSVCAFFMQICERKLRYWEKKQFLNSCWELCRAELKGHGIKRTSAHVSADYG